MSRSLALVACLAVAFGYPELGATADRHERQASDFVRGSFANPNQLERARSGSGLGRGITGWVEYEFDISEAAWYELLIQGSGRGATYSVRQDRTPAVNVFDSRPAGRGGQDKVGNFWLVPGQATVRIERFFWTGFAETLKAVALQRSPLELRGAMRAELAKPGSVFRIGECGDLVVQAGGTSKPHVLSVRFEWSPADPGAGAGPAGTQSIEVPLASRPVEYRTSLPCVREGRYVARFADSTRPLGDADVRSIAYDVVDTRTPGPALPVERVLVEEIDAVSQPPDYASASGTTVNREGGHAFRESAEHGMVRYIRTQPKDRASIPEPGWFAYTLGSVVPQAPHVVEVVYPDNRKRTFTVAAREAAPLDYPVSIGVETGLGEQPSGRPETHEFLFWPRAPAPRLLFTNVHDGERAALARIRLYRLRGDAGSSPPPSPGGRRVVHWHEEGESYRSQYGPPDGPLHWRLAAQRWAAAASAYGFTTLSPTAVVYSYALYPSAYNQAFSRPDHDPLRHIVLQAERYGLEVIPELHPRADELAVDWGAGSDVRGRLLVSRTGRTNYHAADGRTRNYPPLYNPLDAVNQDWLVGMAGELADRYRDSPAFGGISLRFMHWANPGLANFHSIEWGYDAHTVARFASDTGIRVPAPLLEHRGPDDREGAQRRHDWLITNAREAWIGWRCGAVAKLVERIATRVRQARPDLVLQLSLHRRPEVPQQLRQMREAGIDPARLARIGGVRVVNSTLTYGRREANDAWYAQLRGMRADPEVLGLTGGPGSGPSFRPGAQYLEVTDAVATPEELGLPAATKRTWGSSAGTPPGAAQRALVATVLGETDAQMLGDGGNMYTLPQPALREFFREYRMIPARRFVRLGKEQNPVAVWTHGDSAATWFYVVNMTSSPREVRLALRGTREVTRALTGERLAVDDGGLTLRILPYELRAFSTVPATSITRLDGGVR